MISQIIGNTADGGLTNVGIGEAVIFYWICWILAIPLTKVVLPPLFSLTYLESAGEIRRIEWSIPESQVPLPVLASSAEAKRGPGPVVREASGVHAKPLPQLPSPSGVHRVPSQAGQVHLGPTLTATIECATAEPQLGDTVGGWHGWRSCSVRAAWAASTAAATPAAAWRR